MEKVRNDGCALGVDRLVDLQMATLADARPRKRARAFGAENSPLDCFHPA
jgi:hypothetical protein